MLASHTGIAVGVQTAPFPIPHPINVSGKATEDSSGAWASDTHVGDQ